MPLINVIQSYSLFSFQFHRCSIFNWSLSSFTYFCNVVITENFIFVSISVISQFYNVHWFAKSDFTFLNYICNFSWSSNVFYCYSLELYSWTQKCNRTAFNIPTQRNTARFKFVEAECGKWAKCHWVLNSLNYCLLYGNTKHLPTTT
jgi:hypothetical protein